MEPQDESGYSLVKNNKERQFKDARKGEHLITMFQGDRCIFYVLTGRLLGRSDRHQLLLYCIHCMSLEALWSQELDTSYSNLLNVRENIAMWEQLGIDGEHIAP